MWLTTVEIPAKVCYFTCDQFALPLTVLVVHKYYSTDEEESSSAIGLSEELNQRVLLVALQWRSDFKRASLGATELALCTELSCQVGSAWPDVVGTSDPIL